jgi:hypothetical protein
MESIHFPHIITDEETGGKEGERGEEEGEKLLNCYDLANITKKPGTSM